MKGELHPTSLEPLLRRTFLHKDDRVRWIDGLICVLVWGRFKGSAAAGLGLAGTASAFYEALLTV